MWEKEKMLVTSIFSFSHIVFQSLLCSGRLKSRLFGKELTPKLSRRMLNCGKKTLFFLKAYFLTHQRNIALLIVSNFSFFYSIFYLLGEFYAIFIKFEIVICKLFQFWKSPKFVIWERDIISKLVLHFRSNTWHCTDQVSPHCLVPHDVFGSGQFGYRKLIYCTNFPPPPKKGFVTLKIQLQKFVVSLIR